MTTNSEAMRALLSGRYPDADAAFAAIEAAGANKAHFKAAADQGEYILILIAAPEMPPAPNAKPAKAKAKGKGKGKGDAKAKPALSGGRPKAEREKAAKEKASAAPKQWPQKGPARPLDGRKWIGPWANYKAMAEKGQLPDVGGAKLDGSQQRECKFYGLNDKGQSIFHADTHRPFEKRLLALCALIRARDAKALRALVIDEVSTTPSMLAKLRDLSVHALGVKAEKAAKNGKAKADPAPAPQGEGAQA